MSDIKTVATNRKARYDYHLYDKYEAGLVLTGTEIKSVRAGRVNLRDGYVAIRSGEAWLMNTHISPYSAGSRENPDPTRDRKLLLHRRQIERLRSAVQEKGLTIVPTRMYLKDNRAKVEIALARGKKLYDKRVAIERREAERRIRREIKGRER
jgi:SsrA-binding protein